MQHTEQEVPGTDVVMFEQTRFLLGEHNDTASPIGRSLKHGLILAVDLHPRLESTRAKQAPDGSQRCVVCCFPSQRPGFLAPTKVG